MSAARATANRKPPAFKPPRPAQKTTPKKTTGSSATPVQVRKTLAGPSRASKPQSRSSLGKSSRGGFKSASRAIEVSDDEDDEAFEAAEDEYIDEGQSTREIDLEDSDETVADIPSASRRRITAAGAPPDAVSLASQDAPPPIPQKLLTRLLHEGFEDGNTRIGKDAMAVVGKYVELFVREAIARAAAERESEGGGSLGDGFLEVSPFVWSSAILLSKT